MRVAVSAVSRFTDPTGICKHAANIVKSLLLQDESGPITLFLGEWQTAYFDKTLGIADSNRVVIRPIAIQNRSIARNKWFVSELPKLAKQERADILHLSFPIPYSAEDPSLPGGYNDSRSLSLRLSRKFRISQLLFKPTLPTNERRPERRLCLRI